MFDVTLREEKDVLDKINWFIIMEKLFNLYTVSKIIELDERIKETAYSDLCYKTFKNDVLRLIRDPQYCMNDTMADIIQNLVKEVKDSKVIPSKLRPEFRFICQMIFDARNGVLTYDKIKSSGYYYEVIDDETINVLLYNEKNEQLSVEISSDDSIEAESGAGYFMRNGCIEIDGDIYLITE